VSFSTNCCIEASFIGLVVRDAISSWVSVQCIRSVWGAWRMHALISILCGIPRQHARPGKHINLSLRPHAPKLVWFTPNTAVLLVRSSHSSVSAMLPVVAVVLVPCTNSPSQNCRVPPGQPLQPSFQGVAACQRLACEARQASQHRNPICTGACLCTCIPPGCPQTCRAGRCIRPGSPSWDRPLHRRSTWQTGSKQERRALGAD